MSYKRDQTPCSSSPILSASFGCIFHFVIMRNTWITHSISNITRAVQMSGCAALHQTRQKMAALHWYMHPHDRQLTYWNQCCLQTPHISTYYFQIIKKNQKSRFTSKLVLGEQVSFPFPFSGLTLNTEPWIDILHETQSQLRPVIYVRVWGPQSWDYLSKLLINVLCATLIICCDSVMIGGCCTHCPPVPLVANFPAQRVEPERSSARWRHHYATRAA